MMRAVIFIIVGIFAVINAELLLYFKQHTSHFYYLILNKITLHVHIKMTRAEPRSVTE